MRCDHALSSCDVLALCLNVMYRRLSVGVRLHGLLLKVLEHLLKLKLAVIESTRRGFSESLRDVEAMISELI